ncbi:hypothetical protein [Pseudoalteromonas rhizosphaerae]|uniref:hypothetical protein n=1 Tax=Pseudoalteromonas rhizosphaerae TaxID=2518973 RepID=UPI0012317BD1|nr:hypothetical protein [Pseudoalteromonas rhizosphaerae]
MYTRTTFRAKSKVNCRHINIKTGDWVFGSYIENTLDAPCIIFGDGEQIEIDKATLGQFIHINHYGKPVFEHDLIQVDYVVPEESGSTYGMVYFCDNSFTYRVKDIFGDNDLLSETRSRVLGNKFDSPDLFNDLVDVFPDLQPAK